MADLGIFEENEFTVVEPQQQVEPPPPKKGDDEDDDEPKDDTEDEIPLKDKEELIKDLEKAKVGKPKDDFNDEQYDIKKPEGEKPEGGEKPDDEGAEKPDDEGGEKPTDEGNGKPKKKKKGDLDNEKELAEKEKREKIKSKNIISVQIEEYQKVLDKHQDVLPIKIKNTLEKSIVELTEIYNQIK